MTIKWTKKDVNAAFAQAEGAPEPEQQSKLSTVVAKIKEMVAKKRKFNLNDNAPT